MTRSFVTLVAIASLATAGANAQTAPGPTAGLGGGLGGLLGGALPGIGSIGAGNAAGLLGYCLRNNLLGAANRVAGGTAIAPAPTAAPGAAQSVLQRLTGRKDVQAAPGFAAGQAGQVQAGGGPALSLDALRGRVKTQACNLVLDRAKSFL